jgi:hypothetical protein
MLCKRGIIENNLLRSISLLNFTGAIILDSFWKNMGEVYCFIRVLIYALGLAEIFSSTFASASNFVLSVAIVT